MSPNTSRCCSFLFTSMKGLEFALVEAIFKNMLTCTTHKKKKNRKMLQQKQRIRDSSLLQWVRLAR